MYKSWDAMCYNGQDIGLDFGIFEVILNLASDSY